MPLYEDRKNAENIIEISVRSRTGIVSGSEAVLQKLIEAVASKTQTTGMKVLALDGWYGIAWDTIIARIKELDISGAICRYIPICNYFLPIDELKAYKRKYINDDPSFGYVNDKGNVEELFDITKLESLRNELSSGSGCVVIYGCGAATRLLADAIDVIAYFDKTRQPILWQMWDGLLVPFGIDKPDRDYCWKEYYYSDYHMLDHQKNYLYDKMDFWVEAIDPERLKLVPWEAYDEIIRTLITYPIKEIKIYQPGPWGAYRYRELFDVPGLECNAWNELAGPELGVMVCLGDEISIEMPMLNVMRYQAEFLGSYLAETYPRLFPMDVWLDDGYFPKVTPIERTAMPVHNHPSTDYVKRHFNEPLGRYETYYICEAYEGARNMMGFKDDADLERWEAECRASNNLTPIENWKDYIQIWDSNIGDLYLIPPGTVHGHGGNQMVLEMDTCPSIAATEYSFFEYDFARPSWDDNTKTMTGKPLKMQLEHSFDNEKWRRGNWVRDHLLAKPKVVKWTQKYKFDRYTSVPEMPFEIERFHFYSRADNDTEGRFPHILTLTIGKRVVIRNIMDPSHSTTLELFQSAIIPASFGAYEIISESGFCEVVQLRWKKG